MLGEKGKRRRREKQEWIVWFDLMLKKKMVLKKKKKYYSYFRSGYEYNSVTPIASFNAFLNLYHLYIYNSPISTTSRDMHLPIYVLVMNLHSIFWNVNKSTNGIDMSAEDRVELHISCPLLFFFLENINKKVRRGWRAESIIFFLSFFFLLSCLVFVEGNFVCPY